MTAGLAVKTALFPLHFWLPPAHANAPAPVSALLSALVIKASLFILLRLWFYALVPVTTTAAGNFLSGLGAAAIVWGSIQAMRQDRVKLIVAYSTVAQVGYLFLVFTLAHGEMAMLAWRGSAYLACSHACAKAAAFLAAGSLAQALGTDELQQWAGAARREPASVFALALAGVSLMGLPPSGGFIGKWLLLKAALASGQWPLAGIVLLGGLLAAIYIFRVVARTLSAGEPRPASPPLSPLLRYVPLAPALAAIAFGMVTTETLQVLEIGVPLQFLRERAP
jgi:formate hydrogenlyase subunit 3/multisubunit Na+/H+ antiporter MnhD subunit